MQIPIDVKAVIDEATNIDEARRTPLSVSVYLDESAPADLVAHVRAVFASSSPSARVSITYLDGRPFAPYPDDDAAVIVAGLDADNGRRAFELRQVGVPTMVVTTLPNLVDSIAEEAGYPIPDGDLVSPAKAPKRAPKLLPAFAAGRDAAPAEGASAAMPNEGDAVSPAAIPGEGGEASPVAIPSAVSAAEGSRAATAESTVIDAEPAEPAPLTAEDAAALDSRMGAWIIETCRDKRLALALAFPFVRRPLSVEAVNATAMQNAGIGLVMFIPGADLPIMTLNQAKMLLQIAAAYGEPMGMERVKELAAVVGGAFACRAVARQLVAFVPGLGWAIKAAIGYAGTEAMGRAAIEYFEDGGNIAGLAGVVATARDKAVKVASEARDLVTGEEKPAPAAQPEPAASKIDAGKAAKTAKAAARSVADAARLRIKASGRGVL